MGLYGFKERSTAMTLKQVAVERQIRTHGEEAREGDNPTQDKYHDARGVWVVQPQGTIDGISGNTPTFGPCDIYKLDRDTGDLTHVAELDAKQVGNLTDSPLVNPKFYLAVRDRYGEFWVAGAGGAAGSHVVSPQNNIAARTGTTVASGVGDIFERQTSTLVGAGQSETIWNLTNIELDSTKYYLAVKDTFGDYWVGHYVFDFYDCPAPPATDVSSPV